MRERNSADSNSSLQLRMVNGSPASSCCNASDGRGQLLRIALSSARPERRTRAIASAEETLPAADPRPARHICRLPRRQRLHTFSVRQFVIATNCELTDANSLLANCRFTMATRGEFCIVMPGEGSAREKPVCRRMKYSGDML